MKLTRLIAVAALLVTVALSARADNITGRVTVTILDESGTPFPGVVVTLSNLKALAPPVSVQTNGEGKAVFGVVQAGGGYRITIEAPGYAKIQEDNITVAGNSASPFLFKLLAERIEKVKVEASRSKADLDEPLSTSFSAEFLDDLPIIGNSYQDALTLAPGVQDTDGDGNPNVNGARERDFKATLDGISNVDPLTGTFMSNINPDAIEEIEVVAEGADASYGGAVGGFAKVITKQGSNDFEGLVKLTYRNDKIDGNGAQPEPAENFQYDYYRPGVSINGPIVKDKLFYAVNADYDNIGEPIALGDGSSVVIKTTGWRHLDKLTWQASPRNKLNFQFSSDPFEVGPLSNFGGFSALASLDSGFNYTQGGPTYSVTWQVPYNQNLQITSIIGFSDTSISFKPTTRHELNECVFDPSADSVKRPAGPIDEDYCINDDTGRVSGSYYQDYEDKRQRLTLKSDATLFVSEFIGKEHIFDFGVVAEDVHYENDFVLSPFSLFQNEPASADVDGSTISFTAGGQLFRTTYVPGSPDSVNNEADGRRYGAYIQDTFRPHPRVSIKAGVRLDYEKISAPGWETFDPKDQYARFMHAYNVCNPDLDPSVEGICTALAMGNFIAYQDLPANSDLITYVEDGRVRVRKPGHVDIDNTNLGPRMSVSWDPWGDLKTKFAATAGRGYGEIFLQVPTREQGADSFTEVYTVRQSTVADPNFPGGTRVIPVVDQNPSSTSEPSVTYVDRNLRTPYVDEFTFGVTREIFAETSLSLTYIHRDFKDQFQDIDINHFAQDHGDNGLPCFRIPEKGIFVPQGKPDGKFDDCAGRSAFVPGGPFGGGTFVEIPDDIPDLLLRNPFFNQIFQIGNYNTEQYRAYKLEFVRRMHHNWEMEASYVWSKAFGQAEDYLQSVGDDPTTIQDEKGYVGYDQRHVVKINTRTKIPVTGITMGIIANWQSGLPYSLTQVAASLDRQVAFGSLTKGYNQVRTTYPSSQRNDHRNDSYFTLSLSGKKEFRIKSANLTVVAEVANLFNDDTRYVSNVRNDAADAFRRFGRFFEFTFKLNF